MRREARKALRARAKGINDILAGNVSLGVHALNLSAGATAGFCCCVSLNVASNVLTNAAQKTVGAAVEAGQAIKGVAVNAVDVTPDGVKAIGNFFYQWGSYGSRAVAVGLEAVTPISNPTVLSPETLEMLNDATLEPGVVSQIQINYFEEIWNGATRRCSSTDMQCGLLCGVGCCSILSLLSNNRARRAREVMIEGPAVTKMIEDANARQLNRVANAGAAIAAGGAMMLGAPPQAVMSGYNAARAIINQPQQEVRNQPALGYGQVAPPPNQGLLPPAQQESQFAIQNGEPRGVIQMGDDVAPDAQTGLRRRSGHGGKNISKKTKKNKKSKKSKKSKKTKKNGTNKRNKRK
jgi:hypothetical protein